MTRCYRRRLQIVLLVAGLLLTGCASLGGRQTSGGQNATHWQGKLALKIFSQPVQAFSANFDLQGNPAKGALILSSPLGTTLAHMQWEPDSATLVANGEPKHFDSLQAMARNTTGAELPIASLFSWLQGQDELASGWQADLTELASGRITARHTEEVRAELKIILEQ